MPGWLCLGWMTVFPSSIHSELSFAPKLYFYPTAQRVPCHISVVLTLRSEVYSAPEGSVLNYPPTDGKTAKNSFEKLTVVYP